MKDINEIVKSVRKGRDDFAVQLQMAIRIVR